MFCAKRGKSIEDQKEMFSSLHLFKIVKPKHMVKKPMHNLGLRSSCLPNQNSTQFKTKLKLRQGAKTSRTFKHIIYFFLREKANCQNRLWNTILKMVKLKYSQVRAKNLHSWSNTFNSEFLTELSSNTCANQENSGINVVPIRNFSSLV